MTLSFTLCLLRSWPVSPDNLSWTSEWCAPSLKQPNASLWDGSLPQSHRGDGCAIKRYPPSHDNPYFPVIFRCAERSTDTANEGHLACEEGVPGCTTTIKGLSRALLKPRKEGFIPPAMQTELIPPEPWLKHTVSFPWAGWLG